MNKLTVVKGKDKYNILIDDYKIIQGNNYHMKFDILRTLLRFNANIKSSEYAIENNNEYQILINDKPIKQKDTYIYHVNKYYSLTEESKLTSKALLTKYLEVLLEDKEFIDTINTINILLQSLSDEISSISNISGYFNTMVSKQLLKLINPIYTEEDYQKDDYDLTIEELIILQLKMLQYISNNNTKINNIIICIEIPTLTPNIYKELIKLNNTYILIFEDYPSSICTNISKYIICENKYLDISDENQLYEIICDNPYKLLNMKEGIEYMEGYIITKDTEKTRFIHKLLK